MLAIAPTSVTSKPSRIHVIPSPATTSQCHRLHGSRSRRRGIIVSTTGPVSAKRGAHGSSRSSVAFRTRWKPAAVSAPLSTSRHIQPWPLSGLASSSALPTDAKMRPPRNCHSSISSWSPSTSARN